MTLVEFLLARIAEDERSTRSLLQSFRETREQLKNPKTLGLFMPGWHDWPQVEKMCARVLAECEVTRQVIARTEKGCECHASGDETGYGVGWDWDVLDAIARPYADHPDYQQEWTSAS
jgi:hypothetical protein